METLKKVEKNAETFDCKFYSHLGNFARSVPTIYSDFQKFHWSYLLS